MSLDSISNSTQSGIKITSITGNTISLNTAVTVVDQDLLVFSQPVNITEDHITVVRKKPVTAMNVEIKSGPTSGAYGISVGNRPGLFEKELCRFSYRYKYNDGEYSAFGPFTDVIFNPLYPDGVDQDNIISNIQLNKEKQKNITTQLNLITTNIEKSKSQEQNVIFNQQVELEIEKLQNNQDDLEYQLDVVGKKLTTLHGDIQVLKTKENQINDNITKVEELEDSHQAYQTRWCTI